MTFIGPKRMTFNDVADVAGGFARHGLRGNVISRYDANGELVFLDRAALAFEYHVIQHPPKTPPSHYSPEPKP